MRTGMQRVGLSGVMAGAIFMIACGGGVAAGGGGGGSTTGGAAGTVCYPATQAEGCYTVGGQQSRMICDSAGVWALLQTCSPQEYCSEVANPALPGKLMAQCKAIAVPQDTSGGTPDGGGTGGPVCGDGKCEAPENTTTCALDCKAGGPVCGDGKCESPESATSCIKDCGTAAPDSCFGRCNKYEENAKCNCDSSCKQYNDCCKDYDQLCAGSCTKSCAGKVCGSDGCGGTCGECGAGQSCNNGKCETGGGSNSCAGNCGKVAPGGCSCQTSCVDNMNCCSDYSDKCGSTSSACPNGKCEAGEDAKSCPQDCKTDCDGNWTLGSTFYKSEDTSQLGQACNPDKAPKNCPDGLFIMFGDTQECICILNCSSMVNIKEGDNCNTSGTWKCQKIKATNASGNSALACVPTKWNLCSP